LLYPAELRNHPCGKNTFFIFRPQR